LIVESGKKYKNRGCAKKKLLKEGVHGTRAQKKKSVQIRRGCARKSVGSISKPGQNAKEGDQWGGQTETQTAEVGHKGTGKKKQHREIP